jgi:hypothetical protein
MRAPLLLLLLSPALLRADWVAQNNYPVWNLGCSGTPIGGSVVGSDGCFAYNGGSALYTCSGPVANLTAFPSSANCTGPAKAQPPVNGTGTCTQLDSELLQGTACGTSAWPQPAPQTFLISAWPSSGNFCGTPPLKYVNYLNLPIPCIGIPAEARPRLAAALAEARREAAESSPTTHLRRLPDADDGVDVGMPIPLSMQITGCNSDKSMTWHIYTSAGCASGDIPNTFGPTGCIVGDPDASYSVVCEGGAEERDEASLPAPDLTGPGAARLLKEMVHVVMTSAGGRPSRG